jgi:hypothetical protein
MKKNNLFVLLILVLSFSTSFAQNKVANLNIGEIYTYEGKVGRTLVPSISVADITFEVTQAENKKDYVVKFEGKSKGTLVKLFSFSFFQKIETTIDGDKLRVLKTYKRDQQKERIRESEAIFDYGEKKVTYTETDPNDKMRPPRKIASAIEEDTQDLISGIYAVTRQKLSVGKSFTVNVSDSGLVYKVPVKVTDRERINTILGKVWCFKVEPEIFGDGKLIEKKGSLIIWVTDDEKRIPVRTLVTASLGKLDVKLKKIEKKQ